MLRDRAKRLVGESAFEVLARARELEAAGREVVHLEIGQPDFPTPEHVRAAAKRALDEGKTGYGPSPGLPELRAAVAEHVAERRGIDVSAGDVVIAPGAKPLLFYAINSLAGEGDEVVFPDPGFPMYRSLIAHSGARPVPLPLREDRGFRFDADEFRQLVSHRTRLVILNSPHNPTGGVLTKEDLAVIADEAAKREFLVLSDEVYKDFAYDEEFHSILEIPGMRERTILVDGFSKSYSMTGWRLGFGVVPRALLPTFDLYSVNIVSCPCTFGQWGAIEALRGPQEPLHAMVAEFRRRRDYLVDALRSLPGFDCVSPGGAFYAFPNVTRVGIPSDVLARRLLDEAGVACLSGNSFGPSGDGYLRWSYATSMEQLREAVDRVRRFLESAGTNVSV